MEFTSILDLRESPYKEMPGSAFYLDCNLNQVIERITLEWREKVESLYYYFPADRECEAYRREVYGDVKRGGVCSALERFLVRMREWQEILGKKEKAEREIQKTVWHISEAGCYCDAYEELYDALEKTELGSRGMNSFREYLQEYLQSDSYLEMRRILWDLRREMAGFRVVLTYDKERFLLEEREMAGEYEGFLGACFPGPERRLKSPFAADPNLTDLEAEILEIFRKKHPAFFKEARRFFKAYAGYAREELLRFRAEIPFYLSFRRFEQKMQDSGFAFTAPKVSAGEEMYATGLYDLALACVNSGENKKVVSNDMVFHRGESFFVLTGPNQGGKTTFARSLGQLVYFTKMGLDVPAASANVPCFSDILTHFSVEESLETGRGKLKEELVRLKPMMEERCRNAFVVINELFTTAANYDACIMGKRVLEHFIGQGCRGIYVTHLRELSEVCPEVVSLRASLDEHMVQNFKIVRSKAEPAAHAASQVEKYGMTYEQLKARLRERNGQ